MGAQAVRTVRPYTCVLMIRWLIVIFLALLLVNGLHGWLQRIGLGRLPGDFRFRLFGKEFFLPVASTVLLSVVAALIARFVKL
ncbi:DUF2905 family protein [Comamonas sp. AG1104]|nr:DUF2905 family protein [Comamonas sp. AG1104]